MPGLPACASGTVSYFEDFSDAEAQGWTLESGMAVTTGSLSNNWSQMTAKAICDVMTWSGSYVYRVDLRNDGSSDGNKIRVIFNFVNNNNYYYLELGGSESSNTVKLRKVVNSGHTDVAVYSGSYLVKPNYVTVEIAYHNGKISVKGIRSGVETVLFDQVADAAHTAGKIGVGAANSVGRFTNISVVGVDTSLKVVSSSIPDQARGIERDIEIRLGFSEMVNPQTLNKTNVRLKKGDAYLPDGAYLLQLSDGQTAVIGFADPLDYKTTYRVEVGLGVLSEADGIGLSAQYHLTFVTIPPPFELEEYHFNDQSGAPVTSPYAVRGQTVSFSLTLRNNRMAQGQPFAATVAVVGENGAMQAARFYAGTLDEGDSVDLPGSLQIPETTGEHTKIELYLWTSFAQMKKLHPVIGLY